MNVCENCGKDTTNPKFCSKSCSAIWTNKRYPKRKTKKVCHVCGKPVKSYRHNKCDSCFDQYLANKAESYKLKTAGEYRELLSVKGKHASWVNTHIRSFARSWLAFLCKIPCAKCGYDKHVELAHIKPVAEFSNDALLGDINDERNVIQLCRNCHWEFDNLPRDEFNQILTALGKNL